MGVRLGGRAAPGATPRGGEATCHGGSRPTRLLWCSALADAFAPLGLGDPAVEEATASARRHLADPQVVLRSYGAARLLLLLGVGALVVAVWIQADLRSEAVRGRLLFAGLIAVPAIVGLGLMAGPEARKSAQNLREAGLTSPDLVGGGSQPSMAWFSSGQRSASVLAAIFFALLRRTRQS